MFQSQTGLEIAVGTYGDFSLTAGGAWTYTLDDTTGDARGDATNALAAGQERIDAFTVTAEDGTEDGTEATVTITVTGANDAPTATVDDAIRSVPQNAMVTLVGRGVDPDTDEQDALLYAWTQTGTPVVALTDAATDTATFTAPTVTADTRLTFELTVTDPQNASDTATVMVTVEAGNTAATISGMLTGEITETRSRTRSRAC